MLQTDPKTKTRLVTLAEAGIAAGVSVGMGVLPGWMLAGVLTALGWMVGRLGLDWLVEIRATRHGLNLERADRDRLREMHRRGDG